MDVFDVGTAGYRKLARQSHDEFMNLVAESAAIFEEVSTAAVASSSSKSRPLHAPTDPRLPSSPPTASAPLPAPSSTSSGSTSSSGLPQPRTPPWKKQREEVPPPKSAGQSAKNPVATEADPPFVWKSEKGYTFDQYMDLKAEEAVAKELGLKWHQRGPPVETTDFTWRGQAWRAGSERFANRGGRRRDWFVGYYKAKAKGAEHLSEWLGKNPKPE